MARLGKFFLYAVAGIVGIVVIASLAVMLLFDPNDFRDEISAQVRDKTGRELTIEGDLSLSVFPWLAVEIGRTTLGNADGFGDAPFVAFDNARLSVRLVPLIFSREVAVGTASLEGFEANLSVAANGTTNWDDLAQASDAPADTDTATADGGDLALDIANVALIDARINYSDAQSGTSYAVTGVNISTGRIAMGETFDIDGELEFAATPGETGGAIAIRSSITIGDGFRQIAMDGLNVSGSLRGIVSEPAEFSFDSRAISLDSENERIDVGEIELGILGLAISANVEPFSYAGTPQIQAALRVAEFSLKDLLTTLEIEAPVTADPNALQKLSFEANANIGPDALELSSMSLAMDDTTMTGELGVLLDGPSLAFDLSADSITLDNYMAPASTEGEDVAVEGQADFEIPVELVRALKAEGTIRLAEAFLGPVTFTNMQLGVNGSGDQLRLHPITAEFFDGGYSGDVRIDASGDVPSLSVDERISDVNLNSMARALYGTENVTGTINGAFVLGGTGATLSAIAADLDGNMRFELLDGAWEGIDVWYQLRSARAIFKREPAPEPTLPARTEFSSISATGVVTDGVFANDDLLIQMPYLRVTGSGNINLGVREVDYSVQARVLERPEFMTDASEDELADFTEALIPIRITGPLASPSFRPDIEEMFRAEVEAAIEEKTEELKEDLFNRLLGGDDNNDGSAGEGADTEEEEKDLEDELKDTLKDLFPR